MRINIIFLFFYLISTSWAIGQNLVFTEDFTFLGYKDNLPVFNLFEENSEIDNKSLYTIERKENIFGFKKVFENVEKANNIFFINDEVIVRGEWNHDKEGYEVRIFFNDNSVKSYFRKYSPLFSFSKSQNILFMFSLGDNKKENIIAFDFENEISKALILPLKGYRGYILGNWLYFSYYHENNGYSPYPDDIFRVKIGNWHNPELVFTSHKYDNWFLYPEHHIIATDIELNRFGNEFSKKNQILYNVKTSSYAAVSNISKNNSSGSPAYLKYQDKYYGYSKIKDNTRGIQTIGLEPLPELPDSYPHTEHEVLPREVWYNVPLSKKTFDNTFITPYLLREAPPSELKNLNNDQLRLLRNAIYAQYGYVFNSQDLQEFYGQFKWYRMMTAKKENNDDVVLLPEDKERAEMILEIENQK